MLKRWRVVALILVAIAALLFAGSYFFASQYEICGPNEYTRVKDCTQYHSGPFVLAWLFGQIDAHNGIVTAIATIAIAWFTLTLRRSTDRLWEAGEKQRLDNRKSIFANLIAARAARKSTTIAEQTLYISQRSYVSVEPKLQLEVNKIDGSVLNIGFWTAEINQGNTPALNVINRSCAVFLLKKDGVRFSYEETIEPKIVGVSAVIGPHSEITTDTQKFTKDHMIMVREGTAELFLCGWVEYKDVFEGTPIHGIEWCFKVAIEGILRPGECQCRFDMHGKHNRHYDCPPEPSKSAS